LVESRCDAGPAADWPYIMWLYKSSAHRVAEYRLTHAPQESDDFVRACNLPAHSQASAIALAVRDAIAELGAIDPVYIRADDSFDDDLATLPFWGSLDTVGVVLALEQHLSIRISDDDAQCVRHPEFSRGMAVADFVRDVFKAVRTKMAR